MTVVLVASGAESAQSSFPGRNGRLAVAVSGTIYALDPARPSARRLSIGRWREWDVQPAYAPDGERIAFETQGRGTTWISVARSDGSGQKKLRARGAGAPAWSPDGSQLAYIAGRSDLFVSNADGSGARRLATGAEHHVDWSPDGRALVFPRFEPPRPGLEPLYTGLFTIRPDGRGLKRIFWEGESTIAVWPTWSPDGRRIAFTEIENCRRDGVKCSGPVWLSFINPDGSGKVRLVRDAGTFNVWSPDGRALAYVIGDSITVLSLQDGTTREIATPGELDFASTLAWQARCTHRGGPGADRLRGGRSADLACGLLGDDSISGGGGSDRLFGEEGDDLLLARDGVFDVIGCGPGRDRVVADRRDLVGRDCERVSRP
jgi:Tol biopolymer transport system component